MIVDFLYSINLGLLILFFFWVIILIFILLRKPNKIVTPCSDLWRRMFIWWDGKTNPCDVDYKSNLSVGLFPHKTLNQLWRSQEYEKSFGRWVRFVYPLISPLRSGNVVPLNVCTSSCTNTESKENSKKETIIRIRQIIKHQ